MRFGGGVNDHHTHYKALTDKSHIDFSLLLCTLQQIMYSKYILGIGRNWDYDRSFKKAAPLLYNALSVNLKTVPSLAAFKNRLISYLFYKNIQCVD